MVRDIQNIGDLYGCPIGESISLGGEIYTYSGRVLKIVGSTACGCATLDPEGLPIITRSFDNRIERSIVQELTPTFGSERSKWYLQTSLVN